MLEVLPTATTAVFLVAEKKPSKLVKRK